MSFPDTMQGVVAARIDRLPPSQALALKVASVIGRLFAFRCCATSAQSRRIGGRSGVSSMSCTGRTSQCWTPQRRTWLTCSNMW
jgi:hypothetical protein